MAVLAHVEPEWLDASFATINARYGSLEGYLHEGLRLSDAGIASIRKHMLEPALLTGLPAVLHHLELECRDMQPSRCSR